MKWGMTLSWQLADAAVSSYKF